MSDRKVIILGGGPGAIFAYFGALDAGIPHDRIQILLDRFNIVAGAFWLKASPIPWQNMQPTVQLLGEADGYSLKQWGRIVPTSAHRLFRPNRTQVYEVGYNPYTLLPTLWGIVPYKRLYSRLQEGEIRALKEENIAVIQTFPQRSGTDPTIKIPVFTTKVSSTEFTCIYNGKPESPWVRQTLLPGKVFVEYPRDINQKLDMADLQNEENTRWGEVGAFSLVPDLPPEVEPLSWEERVQGNLLLVGRFAHRDRGYLSHQTRSDVGKFLGQILEGGKPYGLGDNVGEPVGATGAVQPEGEGDPATVPSGMD